MKKPSDLDHFYFLVASILCALTDASWKWGQTASYSNRLLAYSPFAAIGSYAAITQNTMLIALVGVVMMATVVVTTASDKWGVSLAKKLQKYLLALESSARQAAQVISSLPHIEKIRLTKIDFTSAILPIAPPPPRRFA